MLSTPGGGVLVAERLRGEDDRLPNIEPAATRNVPAGSPSVNPRDLCGQIRGHNRGTRCSATGYADFTGRPYVPCRV